MTPWASDVNVVTLFVDDLAAAREFYRTVFGLSIIFEDPDSAVFQFGSLMINLLIQTSADELVTPTPVAPKSAGSRLMFTIDVENVDATLAILTERGVTALNGPTDRPWGVRTVAFADPAGHVWEIASKIE